MKQYPSSAVLVLLLLLLGAVPTVLLAASAQRSSEGTVSEPALGQERITLKTSNAPSVALTVEVVDMAIRPEGMLRKTLPENGGLLWLYPQVTDQSLEAKHFPSPMSVAFFDRNGVILQMLDIDPCDIRCPSYFPKVAYRGRLEVAKGWFARQGIEVGSQIEATSIQIMGSGQN